MPVLLVPFLGVAAVLTVTPGPDMLLVLRNGLRGGSRTAWFTGLGCCAGISMHATAAVLGLSAVLAASATAYLVVKLAGAAYLVYLGVRMLLSALRPARADTPTGLKTELNTVAEPDTRPGTDTGLSTDIELSTDTELKMGLSADTELNTGLNTGPSTNTELNTGLSTDTGPSPDTGPDTVRRPVTARNPAAVGAPGRAAAFRQGLFTNLLNPKIALLFLTLLPQFVDATEPRLRTTAVLAAIFLGLAVLWWRLFTLALAPVSRLLQTTRVRRTLDGVTGTVMLAIGAKVALEHR